MGVGRCESGLLGAARVWSTGRSPGRRRGALFRRNLAGRSASHLMIGPDQGGTMWTVCIVEVPRKPGLWRAFNAWPADDDEKDWYNRHR
jgi:hypothetical protein